MTDSPKPVDLLIEPEWIVPIVPPQVLSGHCLAVQGSDIAAILPTAEAHARYAPARHLRLPGHALMPGLVNLHTHAAMTLMRGLADDMPLMTWLKDHIWPAEATHANAEFVHDGSLIACAEMLRGGTTCFNDMYFFPEATALAAQAAGMRAAIGMIVIDFPTAWAKDGPEYIEKGLAVRERFRGSDTISFTVAPHAPYTVNDANLAAVRDLAETHGLPIHMHIHETRDEVEESIAQFGVRPLQRLENLGLLSSRLVAVHMVHLHADELASLRRHGCHVAHCPTSNLKLASGIGPVVEKLEHAANVGIGTDGAASNNRLDMFAEMRIAALLAKGQSRKADAVPAPDALAMATIHGARALGLGHRIGSLEPGKAADMITVDLSRLETSPGYNILSDLVYAAERHQVRHVWVNGKQAVEDGRLLALDEERLLTTAAHWRRRLQETL